MYPKLEAYSNKISFINLYINYYVINKFTDT